LTNVFQNRKKLIPGEADDGDDDDGVQRLIDFLSKYTNINVEELQDMGDEPQGFEFISQGVAGIGLEVKTVETASSFILPGPAHGMGDRMGPTKISGSGEILSTNLLKKCLPSDNLPSSQAERMSKVMSAHPEMSTRHLKKNLRDRWRGPLLSWKKVKANMPMSIRFCQQVRRRIRKRVAHRGTWWSKGQKNDVVLACQRPIALKVCAI
jgi:hypothetical protein